MLKIRIDRKIRQILALLRIISFRKHNLVFLFCSPYHPNMGDHAQTYCIERWYKKNFPNYKMLILQSPIVSPLVLKLLRKHIKQNDLLVFHSGYHLTNLYHEQDVYFRIIDLFHDYPIVFFPQTINYTTSEELEKAKEKLNSHPCITLLCRDEISYKIAKTSFTNCKLYLYPDIVTSMIGTRNYNNERNGILFCMRNDIEAFYKKEEIETLRKRFTNELTEISDTDMPLDMMPYIYKHRGEILEKIWNEYSKYKLIITDRYHGTIFSQIAATPVIVIGSTDHKLSSGVKWFPRDIFDGYISFANNLEEVYILANRILNEYNKYNHKLPSYFKDNYYDCLKDKLYS